MKNRTVSAIVLATALSIAAAGMLWAAGGDLQIVTKDGVGSYLTDGRGMTLYYFKKDAQDKNSCIGPCLEKWPAYYADQVTTPAGSDPKDFGTFTRKDGAKQTTFKGWPLYYFIGDKAAGDTNGQGVKDVWYVVNPISIEPCL